MDPSEGTKALSPTLMDLGIAFVDLSHGVGDPRLGNKIPHSAFVDTCLAPEASGIAMMNPGAWPWASKSWVLPQWT